MFLFGEEGVKRTSLKDLKETSHESDECSAPVLCGSNANATNSDDHEAPLPRVASVSKPTPKPRPRSLVLEMDSNSEVPATAERPIAPPRSKSKSSKGDIEVESQKDHSTKAAKLDAPNRMDMNLLPPVKPKPGPVRNELPGEQLVSPSFSGNESVAVTDASVEDITSNAQDIQTGEKEVKDSPEVEISKAKAKKPVPPPIPRRIDLD